MSDIETFKQQYASAADRAGAALGVSAEILLGQWGLETGWGKSVIPGTHNLGNIKDFSGRGVAATDNMTGSRDKYRQYATPDEFADDYASLIQRKYPSALNAGADATKFATALKAGGYAEDPAYVNKVASAARMAGLDGAYTGPQATGPALPPRSAKKAAKAAADADALGDLMTSIGRTSALADTVELTRAESKRAQDAHVKEQAERDATTTGKVYDEALQDPRVMPTWSILDAINNDREVSPPGWSYMDQKDKIEAGLSDEERDYLRENVTGPQSLAAAMGQINLRREFDQTYRQAGGLSSFAGQVAAGLLDPGSLLLGVGVAKAFGAAKLGHAALAAQGRGGAAAASLLAENALANVAVEGVSDAMGEVKTSGDYVMAATAGVLLAAPFTRGVMREAAHAEVVRSARELQQGAIADQHSKVSAVMRQDPTLTPEQAARRVEQAEADALRRAVDEGTGSGKLLDSAIPDDVNEAIRREYMGEPTPRPEEPAQAANDAVGPPPAVDADADIKPETRQAPEMPDPLEVGVQVQMAVNGTGEVTRSIPTKDGQRIQLSWSLLKAPTKDHASVRETLKALVNSPTNNQQTRRTAQYLSRILSDSVNDVGIRFSMAARTGGFQPQHERITIPTVMGEKATLQDHVNTLSDWHQETVLHEITHAATHSKIAAYTSNRDSLSPALRSALDQFRDLMDRYRAELAHSPKLRDASQQVHLDYATKDLHEFASQVMASKTVREFLNTMPGMPVAGRPSNAWREFISLIKRMLGGASSAFDEGTKLLDIIIQADGSNIFYFDGRRTLQGPAQTAATNARHYAQRLYEHAEQFMARRPIDIERTRVFTDRIGGTSDGLILARSNNPIMQMVASLVTETTTGAAGRGPTVAIRQSMLHKRLVGNAVVDYEGAYKVWRNRNSGSAVEDLTRGERRREFHALVHEETLRRRGGDYTPHPDREVVEAADSLERLFTRAAEVQRTAGTLGSDNLPSSSRGYMPQALDGVKLQALSVSDTRLLTAELSTQFQNNLGWDAEFADSFAPYYLDRVRKRSQGDKGIDGLAAGGDASQVVRDTLDEMAFDPSLRDRALAAQNARAGLGHTKTRLDIDLTTELRPGLRIMDVYANDPLALARTYAKRTAGTVALTEAGIHGIRGIRELRAAATTPVGDHNRVTEAELGAFDRVMAEVLGTPAAGDVISNGATNLHMLVTLQRLGSLPFTQAAETYNMIHHLGLRALVDGVPSIPRLLGEVGRLRRGEGSGNHILNSIEQYGGEIGTSDYKMVAHLDPPDERLGQYVDQPGVMSRLLRAGTHAQAGISGFRGLMAAQHRMAAEQIVMRAARFIRDGGESVALRDMGFSPEVVAAMRPELERIARWDARDKLQSFDLSQVSDPRIAEAFVQAVHRGTAQIIQGTFIGERNKWFHNDYLKLLLQLRSFGLTSAEKQWGRQRMNHGYAYATGMLLGQMALALPIHLARVQLASAGREDREDFVKRSLQPGALVRSVMNYASMSGIAGDILEMTSNLAGGWADRETREKLGVTQQATSVGRSIPVAGTVDSALRVVTGRADLNTAIKQLPFSNLWYLLPAINLTKRD